MARCMIYTLYLLHLVNRHVQAWANVGAELGAPKLDKTAVLESRNHNATLRRVGMALTLFRDGKLSDEPCALMQAKAFVQSQLTPLLQIRLQLVSKALTSGKACRLAVFQSGD